MFTYLILIAATLAWSKCQTETQTQRQIPTPEPLSLDDIDSTEERRYCGSSLVEIMRLVCNSTYRGLNTNTTTVTFPAITEKSDGLYDLNNASTVGLFLKTGAPITYPNFSRYC